MTQQATERGARHSSFLPRTVGALIVVLVLMGAQMAATTATASAADITTSTALTTPEPSPSVSATPSPDQTPSEKDRHEKQNGEQPVERDDLGFLGIIFLIGIAFILVAGAVGVMVAGRKRRFRDRLAAESEDRP